MLELTYTAHDMAPFARDMGYVDNDGKVKPPFKWDEKRRLKLRAKLDAVYFHLYGVTDRDDVRYIYPLSRLSSAKKRKAHSLPLARPLPRVYERARGRRPGRGDLPIAKPRLRSFSERGIEC